MNKFTQNVRAKKKIDNSNRAKHKHFARFYYTTKPYSFLCVSNKVICAFSYRKKKKELERHTF